MFKLVVLDWDGTLMDSADRIVSSVNAALEDMRMAPLPDGQIRNIIGLGLREAVEALLPGRPESLYERFIDHYREHFLVADPTPMPLFEGVPETLEHLLSAGYLLAVATGKSRRGLDRVLRDSGLHAYFVATRCADETRSKPHPQMLLELMSETGAAPEETLMVGDSVYDLEMALNAGVARIGVGYGVHGCPRLLPFAPLTCLNRISDLVDWLPAAR